MHKNLEYFFSAYFHQDWREIEGENKDKIIDNFVSNESQSVILDVLNELLDVLSRNNYIPINFVYDMGCFMIPEADLDGNIKKWLYEIYECMSKKLNI